MPPRRSPRRSGVAGGAVRDFSRARLAAPIGLSVDLCQRRLREEPTAGLAAPLNGFVDTREDALVDGDEDAFGWHGREVYTGMLASATLGSPPLPRTLRAEVVP
jgi:hypothetical protein